MEMKRNHFEELEETMVLSQTQDTGYALELEVTVAESESQSFSNSEARIEVSMVAEEEKERKEEEEGEEVKTTTTTAHSDVNGSKDSKEPEKDERMDKVEGKVEKASTTVQEETRKRGAEEDVEPVLERIPSGEPSCGSDLIRINKDQFKIGRRTDNDEVIVSVLISRNHCILQRNKDTGDWSVTNLSSTDTLLNGRHIERNKTEPIKHGDTLQLSLAEVFKYKFLLVNKELEAAKCPRLEDSGNDLGGVLDRQRSFVELQKSERKDLEKQLTDKQQEQEQLKQELNKLLDDQKVTKECNEELNNQIIELQKKIEVGNATEMGLQQKYRELLGKLEEERLKFEEKLAAEKVRWQEALKESKQEKEKLELTHANQMEEMKEQLVKKQQEEWQKKVDNLLQEEKNVQTKLQSEKQLLEQRLKEMEEDIKKKDHAAKVQQQMQQNLQQIQQQRHAHIQVQFQQQLRQQHQLPQPQQKAINLAPINMGKCILVEVKRDNTLRKLPVLETIDLTKTPDTPGTSSNLRKNSQGKEVIDKVSNIMDEQLTCSICTELFIRAVTLSNCMHTFCQHCIEVWSKRRRECPNCRAAIVSMTRSLVVDNFIEKMIESLTPEQMQKRKQLIEERQRLPASKEIQRKVGRRR
ncbi:E3 ubiquitin-protein ligase RNF8-like [Copidosoma floridanum]|uniref:E3 ubiquitin-protein ligase RNF8-like n=1 Tax=Copidosoma floridanum TaxID=29053 RepID=UPI0006C9760B|nr:E3 ubiquitin-protein ligase RNF8-like [Copidosoma floridanum]